MSSATHMHVTPGGFGRGEESLLGSGSTGREDRWRLKTHLGNHSVCVCLCATPLNRHRGLWLSCKGGGLFWFSAESCPLDFGYVSLRSLTSR